MRNEKVLKTLSFNEFYSSETNTEIIKKEYRLKKRKQKIIQGNYYTKQ